MALWLALLVSSALACGRPEPTGAPFLARYLEHDATDSFRRDELTSIRPTAVAGEPGCPLDEGWQVVPAGTTAHCAGTVLVIPSSPRGRQAVLFRHVDFDAGEVDAFHLTAQGITRQIARVEWVRAGERFGRQRRIEGPLKVAADPRRGQVRLRVAGHPQWRGRIVGVRLVLTIGPRRTARVVAFSAVRESVDAGGLERAVARPWKIDLAGEMRSGLLGLPGRSLHWETDAAPGAELRFAYGILGSCAAPIRFEVREIRDGEAEPLFDRRMPCDGDGWHEARVSLGNRTGGPLTLEFETAVDSGFEPVAGLPVWAGIELVGGRPRPLLNVVLISVDTLRPDHLSLYGYPRETTPRLDERSGRGAVVFERAVASAPWTLPSHASIFTGLDAVRHGVNQHWGLPPSLLTLAEILRNQGYATHAVTGGGFVHQQYGFAQGFDAYASFSDRMGFAAELDAGVAKAKARIEALRDRNFFLFFHTYAVHNPYRPHQPHLHRLTGRTTRAVVDVDLLPAEPVDGLRSRRALFKMEDGLRVEAADDAVRDLAVDLYDSAIAYTDQRLDDLLEAIDDLGLRERTLIVLTSDHGELFGEHGQYNHISLFDENVMVPLVFIDPALAPGVRRVSHQVRSIDLLPTILDRLGVPPPEEIDGRSFAPLLGRSGRVGDGAGAGTGDAWSYASASNYGISLRRVDGTTYVARNDAWISNGARELLLRAPGGAAEMPALRGAAERHLEDFLAGLRLRLRNPGRRPFTVAIPHGLAMPTRMKLERIGDGVLTAEDGRPSTLTLPPGREVTLIVEGPTASRLRLVIRHPRWGATGVDLDPAALELPLWGEWTASGWSLTATEPPGGGILAAWWRGPTDPAEAAAPAPTDPDLLRQLRALGYLR